MLSQLTNLDLSSNRISDTGGASLCHLLLPSASCALAHFALAGNHSLGSSTCRKLAQALSCNTCLQDLNVSKLHLGEILLDPQRFSALLLANSGLFFE